jgi:hypothetical protein
MPRTKPIGLPASAVLAGGITRHGPHCGCAYCAPDVTATDRQAIPVVGAGVLQPPVPVSPPPTRDAIGEAFAAARETVEKLEQERDARDLIGLDLDWSPAQVCRRAA